MIKRSKYIVVFSLLVSLIMTIAGCARMGSPDGGWYDEKPPRVIHTYPSDGAVNISQKSIAIYFDEYIKLDNPTEKVIISPPQIEQADIKNKGRYIVVELKDSLKENTTYTIDFSDAISDNNENNSMGNYTYKFSTGNAIDTLEVGGYVLDSETLEPVKGIQVGLYKLDSDNESDSIIINRFKTVPLLRVSKTDENGHFSVKGVQEGKYRVYALGDMDNNFMLTPNSGEQMAFWNEIVVPSVFDDFRQDTTMLDSLRIKSIDRVQYKHFIPDNLMLRAFTEPLTNRGFIKNERTEADRFTLYFSYGDSILPEIKGLNFDFNNKYVLETSAKNDTLTYWLSDTALVNTDSLEIEMTYRMTDSLGILQPQTDTLMLIPKVSYERRMKNQQKVYEDWLKKEMKKKRRGEPYDSIMAPEPLKVNITAKSKFDPDKNISIDFPTPLMTIDTAKIHLYIERDSVWYNSKWEIRNKPNTNIRTFEILAEWEPGMQYSFELDSAAFVDIYGNVNKKEKTGLHVRNMNEYGTFQMNIPSLAGKNLVMQLLQDGDKIVKEEKTTTGTATFYYLEEKTYYLRVIVDDNNNGIWDTGRFDELLQPEQVYYYPKEISCRANWDITSSWNPDEKPLNQQKPSKLRKNKSATNKKAQLNKNLRRAQDMGIMLPDHLR